jgi:membrane-associated phospholipid phosphatase
LRILSPHRAIFVLASFGIGSLIVVHALKVVIGRARPSDTLMFSGDKEFSPAWQVVDMCGASCSFPSGEAAAAAALLSFVVYFSGRTRLAFLAAILPLAMVLSANRVLVGAHFFSDVVLAWLMVFFVSVSLWRYIEPRGAEIDARVRQAGEGARRYLYGDRARRSVSITETP